MKDAAFSTIGAIAVHAVRTGRVQVGETVGVIGAGLGGNAGRADSAEPPGAGWSASTRGRTDSPSWPSSEPTLRSRLTTQSLVAHVSHFTRGVGLDHIFVCAATSSSDPLNTAARIARNRARIVVVGRVGMEIERKDFYQKELTLSMSRSLGPGRYDPVYEEKGVDYPIEYVRWTLNRNMEAFMDLLVSGGVKVDPLVGAEYPLDSAASAYLSLTTQSKTAVLLSYRQQEAAAISIPKVAETHGAPRTGDGKDRRRRRGPGELRQGDDHTAPQDERRISPRVGRLIEPDARDPGRQEVPLREEHLRLRRGTQRPVDEPRGHHRPEQPALRDAVCRNAAPGRWLSWRSRSA